MKNNKSRKREESNFHIFIGATEEYLTQYSDALRLVDTNWGVFSMYWNTDNQITNGHMFINSHSANFTTQMHLPIEKLTQAMGPTKDSGRYPEGIFYSDRTNIREYPEMDKELIRILYHPKMGPGSNQNQVDHVLKDILMDEISIAP